jgi:hypothetical protein
MIKVANRSAKWYVTELQEFKGNNTFAVWESDKIYVVYSFGDHWILYIYVKEDNAWLGCDEKASISTNKHRTQLHPNAEINEWLPQDILQQIKHKLK